jgi:deoxyhypusine synthase
MTQTAAARPLPDRKAELLAHPVEHIDITAFDARPIVDAMGRMSFTARSVARAAQLLNAALRDPDCTVVLSLAGSTSAAGCMRIYADMARFGMIDAVVATGASIVDMDFFEALGFRHYQGNPDQDDHELRENYIDRIYDTYIDEEELQHCDATIGEIADSLPPRAYTSREFIHEMGRYLKTHANKKGSLVEACFDHQIPIFCPAFTDSSAGFGLVAHQERRPDNCLTIDSVREFRELTEIKIRAGSTALFMIGGGVPKNFIQDTVVCAEILGHKDVPMHKYAVQITVADARDGACSSSTLKEAHSWGKVDTAQEQMVYAEATAVLPLLISDAYHRGHWKGRPPRAWSRIFQK